MRQRRDGKGMWKREGVETLETVDLRGRAATRREQGNDGGETQGMERVQCGAEEDERDEREGQGAALAVLLGQMVAYLSGRVDANDLDIVSFSLHHLFCGYDSLYRTLLPSFVNSLALEVGAETDDHYGHLCPLTWLQLQDMRQVVSRMQPLCQLLSEAGECMLGQLGYGQESAGNEESEERVAREKHEENRAEKVATAQGELADEPRIPAGRHEAREQAESEQDILFVAASAGVEQALKDLTASLTCWQQHYCNLPSFRSLLYALFPTIPLPFQPDVPFTHLLDGASTLFGDILPAFHALSPGDDDAVIQLLFDLLQQIDLLTVECETLLQLFHLLLQQHSIALA